MESARFPSPAQFHLSHNYPTSISHAEGSHCAFVQTGVIGKCNRDGERQSRVLKMTADGFEVHTLDHATGELRIDLQVGEQNECRAHTAAVSLSLRF